MTISSSITSTADILQKIVAINDKNTADDHTTALTRFFAARPPAICIENYARRLANQSKCSHQCFILAIIYVDRLVARGMMVNSRSVHRILLTCLLIAIKFLDDDLFDNQSFSKFGGISNSELNSLEVELLDFLEYDIVVEQRHFEEYSRKMETLLRNDSSVAN